jgi:chemotaxis protein CheD
MGEAIMVGMAQVKVTQSRDDLLIALGLGSSICICAFDAQASIAAMAHVVLPENHDNETAAGKYADTAIPLLIESMSRNGATSGRIQAAIVGGAQLFAFNGAGVRLEIGPRNIEAVRQALEGACVPVVAADLGGTAGRSVHLTGDGRVRVKVLGRGETELVHLGEC